MRTDDETTAVQLRELLTRYGIHLSLSSVLRSRELLGLTFRGSAYCQLICEANRQKRLAWAHQNLHNSFEDIIWSDESSIQLKTHRRYCYIKVGEPPVPKPRAKHPVKVHVWAGISFYGATSICIFEGIMDAELYALILDRFLLPFIDERYPFKYLVYARQRP